MENIIMKRIKKGVFDQKDFNRWMGQLGIDKKHSKKTMVSLLKKGKLIKLRGGCFCIK